MPDYGDMRSGFVAIVGRPNTGKSTLLNRLAHEKVAIVSDKPQTTRHAIRAVVNRENVQLILVDTPGYHKPHHLLGERLNNAVESTLSEVDAILFLVDIESGVGRGDRYVAETLAHLKTPVILCLNKTDAVTPEAVKAAVEKAGELGNFHKIVPISGLEGQNVDTLLDELSGLMPPGPMYYPEGMTSDQPEQVVAAEMIREKILAVTREEVPHSVAIEIERMAPRQNSDLVDIEAFVYVERATQKGIIIGHEGAVLKQIGTQARLELEAIFGTPIFLSLRVKVRKGWRKDAAFLARLGIR